MDHQSFERPVTVLVGLGLPTEVGNVMEAYTLLNEWPPSKRTPTHEIALNACKAALVGDIDPETARATFVAFARKNDMLASQAEVGRSRVFEPGSREPGARGRLASASDRRVGPAFG
jgi:hypothetical protein